MKKTILSVITVLILLSVSCMQFGKSIKIKNQSNRKYFVRILEVEIADHFEHRNIRPKDSGMGVVAVYFRTNDPDLNIEDARLMIRMISVEIICENWSTVACAGGRLNDVQVLYFIAPKEETSVMFVLDNYKPVRLKLTPAEKMKETDLVRWGEGIIAINSDCGRTLLDKKVVGEKALEWEREVPPVRQRQIPETSGQSVLRQEPPPVRQQQKLKTSEPDDDTIDLSDFDMDEEPPPPPPPPEDEDAITFVPYDEPPTPVGGFEAIQRKLVYPEIARKAGVEGRVLVYIQVGTDGQILRTKIMKSLGPNGCDEAAIDALKAVKWKPAKQREKPVTVWIAVPVDFRMR